MKIGVYDLYWSTFGGGEQQAGGIVDALSGDHDVEMLGPEKVDLRALRERLGLRLENVTFRRVPADQYAATRASADYDLFINHTYRSTSPNLARLGIYFVMFPHVLDEDGARPKLRRVGFKFSAPARILSGVVWPSHTQNRIVGPVLLQIDPGARSVEFSLQSNNPEQVEYTVIGQGAVLQRLDVESTVAVQIDLPPGHAGQVLIAPVTMAFQRDTRRRLHFVRLAVDGVEVDTDPRSWRQRLVAVRHRDFLATYQHVVALSEYTRRWTQEWWGRDADVLSPPVRMRHAGDKQRLIVSLGRFFAEGSGHSKRQLDMVRAFRQLVESGAEGWRLVLIGGCAPADREYAMAVRREAAGLPVEVRLNAPGSFVDETLAAASIYWHAAGLGSDLDAHPDRAEHFGIAPIEAMSAGAVPIVFDAAGPGEIVSDDVDGLHFRSLEQLVAHTRRLIAEPATLARLSGAAEARARLYDRMHFEQNVRDLVRRVSDEG